MESEPKTCRIRRSTNVVNLTFGVRLGMSGLSRILRVPYPVPQLGGTESDFCVMTTALTGRVAVSVFTASTLTQIGGKGVQFHRVTCSNSDVWHIALSYTLL